MASTPTTTASPSPSVGSDSTLRVRCPPDFPSLIEKVLECPVCYDVILPPIFTCTSGHATCHSCRGSVTLCPVCRAPLSSTRNLLAEQLLERFSFTCRHDCGVVLPAPELAQHYHAGCERGPIHCRECDRSILYQDFLTHVEQVDKLEKQRATECSTGFEIDEEDLNSFELQGMDQEGQGQGQGQARRPTVWEPTWMQCYDSNFFCSLDFNGENWWIWVASLEEGGRRLKCQIILWSREKQSEFSYFGTVHSIRTDPDTVLASGECLILSKSSLKKFMYHGGIDVLVRIEPSYNLPKTRRGFEVQSPLDIMAQGQGLRRFHQRGQGQGQGQGQPHNGEGDASPASSATTRTLRSQTASRIPQVVQASRSQGQGSAGQGQAEPPPGAPLPPAQQTPRRTLATTAGRLLFERTRGRLGRGRPRNPVPPTSGRELGAAWEE